MATRNPVRVLPLPVGDATRTSDPWAMCGQAASWGAVGPWGNRPANQAATAGWNWSTSGGAVCVIPLFNRSDVTSARGDGELAAHVAVVGVGGSRAGTRSV